MGKECRKISQEETELGRLLKATVNAGHQVSPKIIGDIMQQVIKENSQENVIYDGFIRNQ